MKMPSFELTRKVLKKLHTEYMFILLGQMILLIKQYTRLFPILLDGISNNIHLSLNTLSRSKHL